MYIYIGTGVSAGTRTRDRSDRVTEWRSSGWVGWPAGWLAGWMERMEMFSKLNLGWVRWRDGVRILW